ncbi:hypothetical protein E2C01_005859 [Portunus trituberculatus]|uniref:Uncharacterized protein n=1 Tax=Portunus trituberculatus TaxID=210409 RepID=A0A5B7CVD1_PORTR|nr:hypothetical protein [Portunus trituberculatus]
MIILGPRQNRKSLLHLSGGNHENILGKSYIKHWSLLKAVETERLSIQDHHIRLCKECPSGGRQAAHHMHHEGWEEYSYHLKPVTQASSEMD